MRNYAGDFEAEPPSPPALPPVPPPVFRRGRKNPTLGPRHDGRTLNGVEVPCDLPRLSRDELLAMTPEQRARALEHPTMLTGMADGWPAFEEWAVPANFSRRYGHHRVMAKRVLFGHERAAELGITDVMSSAASVSLAELVQRTQDEHVIVLDERGQTQGEDTLLNDLRSDYWYPELLHGISSSRVFSFGGGVNGVQMMQHGVAWLTLVTGAKLWATAPRSVTKPRDLECGHGASLDYLAAEQESVAYCLMVPGETIVVPEKTWHATCNLDPYTIGVGGQLWADGRQGKFETAIERDEVTRDDAAATKAASSAQQKQQWRRANPLVPDVPLYDVVEPIIFHFDVVSDDEEEEKEAASVSPLGGVAARA